MAKTPDLKMATPEDATNSSPSGEVIIELPDNRLLINLCGEFDRNLAQIEQRLEVQILRRGNQLAVMGEAPAQQAAVGVLTELYERLEAGKDVEPIDIDRALRTHGPGDADDVAETMSDQLEMFKGGPVEIKTRKKTVEPRTTSQKQLIESVFSNEVCFVYGPAGTGKTYLSLAAAVSVFVSGEVDRIVLIGAKSIARSRPEGATENTLDALTSLSPSGFEILNDFLPTKQLVKLVEERKIEVCQFSDVVGRTFKHSFVAIDDAHLFSIEQMKVLLTRLGEGSRMVVVGSFEEAAEAGRENGLEFAVRSFCTQPGVGCVQFSEQDVVRHPFVAKVVSSFVAGSSPAGSSAEASLADDAQSEDDYQLSASDWEECKKMILEEYIGQRLDSPENHLSFIRKNLAPFEEKA